ncbi:hypothetical protein FOA43_003226 [Brettanomyces nanus]|uniref:Glycoside hydrolase family 2 n=1 Tax=Eeniella nana TaxID=13502 RepID=A0A875S4K7_EENNA|nr:uncharacterized protein FOA43_003226 [Brettanomyces nanus]QPG75843.1 hypothetical protein FOA43_003226 [Brettanomyces nanus]
MTASSRILYPLSNKEFDNELFKNPSSDYRGAPLWCWNCKLDKERLLFEIDTLKDMGFGGFHIHSRVGLDTPYLGDEFMSLVKECHDYGKSKGLITYLYDEDRFPSGSCGGKVPRENPEYRAKYLMFTSIPYGEFEIPKENPFPMSASRNENGELLCAFKVYLKEGYLSDYERVDISNQESLNKARSEAEATPGCKLWYGYLEHAVPSGWYNNSTYVDTLNADAIKCFIETTHVKYRDLLQADFKKTVKSIFTDEPQFSHKSIFEKAESSDQAFVPWTTDLPETFQKAYSYSIFEKIPELFWELPDRKPSVFRYHYHDHVCQRFTDAFVKTISKWCSENNLGFTGHMLDEEDLLTQTTSLGEAMRAYPHFDIPGIDMLQDKHEYHTAKQCQSVVHQYGKEGMMCEMYGVTNWDFTFQGHKSQGDWLAALGVTFRVPHLYWMSMRGEAKRDFPASIGYQSSWYKKYTIVEDHFSRLNIALTRGSPVVRIGVIHPIESYWLAFGTWEQTKLEREERQVNFDHLIKWMLFGLLDFDYVAESLLEDTTKLGEITEQFPCGVMKYDVIVVPSLRTIRRSTLERLEMFAAKGGKVVFMGEVPSLVDAVPTTSPAELAKECTVIPFTKRALYTTLEPYREIGIDFVDPVDHDCLLYSRLKDSILYNMRQEVDGSRYLFLCNTSTEQKRTGSIITIKGNWDLTIMDTFTAEQKHFADVTIKNGKTTFHWDFSMVGSLLLKLVPTKQIVNSAEPIVEEVPSDIVPVEDDIKYTLSEPNVLMLDFAESFRIDEGEWQASEEVLRIDNIVRSILKLQAKNMEFPQPYSFKDERTFRHSVTMRFNFVSEEDVESPILASELKEDIEISIDGVKVEELIDDGYFVDKDIYKIKLPSFKAGSHTLSYKMPMNQFSNIERLYLLGDFGVRVNGKHTKIVKKQDTLVYGNWVEQGLPFYAGNVVYRIRIPDDVSSFQGSVKLRIREFKAPLIGVSIDGKDVGSIAFDPFKINLGNLKGKREIELTVYGDRFNSFGHIHFANSKFPWCAPNAWRTVGDQWTYSYLLQPKGITETPTFELYA